MLKANKCDFCKYWTGKACMTTPNSGYCKEALDEYYQHLRTNKNNLPKQKSLRSWDK